MEVTKSPDIQKNRTETFSLLLILDVLLVHYITSIYLTIIAIF